MIPKIENRASCSTILIERLTKFPVKYCFHRFKYLQFTTEIVDLGIKIADLVFFCVKPVEKPMIRLIFEFSFVFHYEIVRNFFIWNGLNLNVRVWMCVCVYLFYSLEFGAIVLIHTLIILLFYLFHFKCFNCVH